VIINIFDLPMDCLVFSDQLLAWCNRGYDYVGAPWFKSQMIKRYDYPMPVAMADFLCVGLIGQLRLLKKVNYRFGRSLLRVLKR
jgi:small ligand-binding sensory domain FIST